MTCKKRLVMLLQLLLLMLLLPMAQGQATTDVLDNLDNIILGLVPPEKGTENEPGQNVEESQFTAAESSTAEVLE